MIALLLTFRPGKQVSSSQTGTDCFYGGCADSKNRSNNNSRGHPSAHHSRNDFSRSRSPAAALQSFMEGFRPDHSQQVLQTTTVSSNGRHTAAGSDKVMPSRCWIRRMVPRRQLRVACAATQSTPNSSSRGRKNTRMMALGYRAIGIVDLCDRHNVHVYTISLSAESTPTRKVHKEHVLHARLCGEGRQPNDVFLACAQCQLTLTGASKMVSVSFRSLPSCLFQQCQHHARIDSP